MKKLMLLVMAILLSCAPAKRNWNYEKVERKMEKSIKKGMRYNHNCIDKEKELKLKNNN